jgi:thioredoxin-like negative regulator of GroEL
MSIPALHVFKGGREVNKAVGALPKDQIKALIESAL